MSFFFHGKDLIKGFLFLLYSANMSVQDKLLELKHFQ